MISEYSLEARTDVDATTAIVNVGGEIDLTNANELEARLEDVCAGKERLVLDFNGVTFVDSAALHVLFRLARRFGRDRFAVAIAANGIVARALAIVELDRLATVRASVEDCLTAVAATR